MSETETENKDKRALQWLENDIKTYDRIFIDTCSLMYDKADLFWSNILPLLQREGKSLVIPYQVYEELEKFANDPSYCTKKNPNDPNLNKRAIKARNNIVSLNNKGIVQVFGDKSDKFADNVFLTVFTQKRLDYSLMLITQDKDLASDIFDIGKSRSNKSKYRIIAKRINKYGFLSMHDSYGQSQSQNNDNSSYGAEYARRRKTNTGVPENEKFAVAKTITQIDGEISVSYIPKEGDTVVADTSGDRHQLKLIKSIAKPGGEGTVYDTDIPGIVAKIYNSNKIDKYKHDKLKLMLTKPLECEGICFPISCLYNEKNEFVGYTMKKAQGKVLDICVFKPKLIGKYFPTWTRKETVELCITILQKIKYMHDRNILLGDINPRNILVASSKEVYFVDTDSYQIEGYPCPVGFPLFTAPEIQKKEFKTFLRTVGNEMFAVATLLFMIMLPGKSPYAMLGGGDQIENIINGDFAYASGKSSTGQAPDGTWRFMWSNLPRYLKDDFYNTFRKEGGKNYKENNRFSTDDWIEKFEEYLHRLESGKMVQYDEQAIEIFPIRNMLHPDKDHINCIICGIRWDDDRLMQGICPLCQVKGETYLCSNCGDELIYTNRRKLIENKPRFDICLECANGVYTHVTCQDCRTVFPITHGQKEFFERNGMTLPKRCKSCRERNRTGNAPARYSSSSSSNSSAGSNRSASGCSAAVIVPIIIIIIWLLFASRVCSGFF